MKRYLVWLVGGNPKEGKYVEAANSLEARQICGRAWGRPIADLMARRA